MCELAGAITAMAAVIGGVTGLADSAVQAQSARAQQEYSAAVARSQAQQLLNQAEYAKEDGEKQLDDEENRRNKVLASIKTRMGAANVTMNGSPGDALTSAETEHISNKDSIINKTNRDIANYNYQAELQLASANNSLSQSVGSLKALSNAGTSLLSAGGNLYNSWKSSKSGIAVA